MKRTQFFAGLLVGGVLASALVGLLLALVLRPIAAVLDESVTRIILAVTVSIFVLIEMADRRVGLARQTPQRFVNILPAGPLGLVYGFDIGLLFSIQKQSGLIWIALIGIGLIAPVSLPFAVVCGHLLWWAITAGEVATTQRKGFLGNVPWYRWAVEGFQKAALGAMILTFVLLVV